MVEPAAEGDAANLGDFRQAVLNNNMRLMEVASPQPYERDGKFLGFQLSPGSNVAMFNQLGLQAGDIVTAVNGTTLENPAIAMRLLQEAATASQVNLNITRNGQEVSLPINFQ
jgi:general secretion pathway protein C